jgi:ribonuclease
VAEFAYDALGYLERVQVGECVSSWVRDTSGAVMGYTEEVLGGADEPSGSSSGVVQGVRVRRNPAGKITRVEDTVKGSWCEYAYDASGRLIRAVSSDDVSVVWVYDPVGLLMREETHQEGSLVRVRAFSYAGERVQTVRLYEALEDGGSSVAPVAGVVEDLAGLDASSLVCTGSIQYSYDVRGFRTGAVDHAGSAVRWGWDALGSLELVERINHTPESLLGSHVAAGGEDSLTGNSAVCFAASSVRNMPVAVGSQQDGQGAVVSPLIWDTTVPDAASLVGVGVTEAVSAGSVLGGRDSILTDTGAGAYGFGTDIFGVASPVTWGSNTTAAAGNGLPGLPADAGLTAQGALATVGGELMGARLYDPVTAGFLSPDPMEPVAGAGYMGASYLFASGDPVNLHDPTGLQPIPAEAMRKYTEYIESDDFIRDFDRAMAEETKRHWDGFWSVDGWKKSLEELQKDPGRWFNDHGKDVLAGVVFVGGLLLMIPQATRGVGGTIVTSMLFSAVLQKWEYGDLNPDQLTLDGLLGGITAAAVVLYLQRLERLQSMSGMTLRLEATQLSVNAPRLASKGPKKLSFQDFFAGGFFKSQEAAPLTGLYRDGAEGARTVNELRHLRYPKVEIEVKPVAGGASSATEVPPVAVSRVDVPQVAPVEGSGASRGASQVPVKPVEAPQVGEVPPASGAGSGAAGMQAVKPGGVADDAVAARGSAGGVREPEVQLKPVEEPKVENLTPEGREAVRVLRDDRSLQPIHSEVDKPAQQIMYPNDLKSWVDTELPQASRIGSASEIDGTPVRYHNKFGKFRDAKRDYYQGLENGGVEGPRPEFSPWKAEKTKADYNTAFEGLSEVEKTKHSIISLDKFKGVIPQEIKESVKSIWETGRLPEDKLWKKAQGPKEYENVPENDSGGHILPEKDVEGNPITYTEYDVKPPELTNKENGKLGLDRGKHRLLVGSNGSIYYSPDHYLTFIRLID